MKNLLRILSLVFAISLWGCEKPIDELSGTMNEKEGVETTYSYRIFASTEVGSKVSIDGASIRWKAGDEMKLAKVENGKFVSVYDSINPESTDLLRFYIDSTSISKDGKSAEFLGPSLEAGASYMAVVGGVGYYYDETESEDGSSSKNLAIQTESYNWQNASNSADDFEGAFVLTSPVFTVQNVVMPSLTFKNRMSILKLEVSLKPEAGDINIPLMSVIFESDKDCFIDGLLLNAAGEEVMSNTFPGVNQISADMGEKFYNDSTGQYDIINTPMISSTQSYVALIPFRWNNFVDSTGEDFRVSIVDANENISTVTFPARKLANGRLYSKSLTFDVKQDSIKPSISVAPSMKTLGMEEGDFTITVTTNAAWKVEGVPDWLDFNPTSGSGDTTISVSYSANDTEAQREASLTFSIQGDSQSLTVTQGINQLEDLIPEDLER